MPKGYPDTVTCKECEIGQPADFQYCPDCGARLPRPRWETRYKAPTASQEQLKQRQKYIKSKYEES